MSDSLEQFINDNREGFDIYEPEPLLWEAVSIRKKTTLYAKILNNKTIIRVAALLILAAGIWTLYVKYQPAQKNQIVKIYSTTIPELAEAETFYQAKLNEKMSEIQPLIASHPAVKQSLNTDMAQLDSIYHELKKDMGDGMDNEVIVDAMIKNYRMKIKILENVLFYIKKSKGDTDNLQATEKKEYEI